MVSQRRASKWVFEHVVRNRLGHHSARLYFWRPARFAGRQTGASDRPGAAVRNLTREVLNKILLSAKQKQEKNKIKIHEQPVFLFKLIHERSKKKNLCVRMKRNILL